VIATVVVLAMSAPVEAGMADGPLLLRTAGVGPDEVERTVA
jgi:hypothetical protein